MAIVVDDYVVSAPVISGTMSRRFQIAGNFSSDEAKLLADMLNSGKRASATH